MTTIKSIILTAIHYKGVAQVRREAKEIADNCFCSENYVFAIIRKVEKAEIIIKKESAEDGFSTKEKAASYLREEKIKGGSNLVGWVEEKENRFFVRFNVCD